MNANLVVNRVIQNIDTNLNTIQKMVNIAANSGADLVVFPEAALTGLINTDVPAHDLSLGQKIPGPITQLLSKLTKKLNIWLAIGVLEYDRGRIYDSAVLISSNGEIALKYRRIQSQWHGENADSSIYCQGKEVTKVETPFGTFAFLLCGDLFDDEISNRVRILKPDWLLLPIARCFKDGSYDQKRFDKEEKQEYISRVKLIGVTTLITNYLADKDLNGGAFGGAMVISSDGTVIDCFPLGESGILSVNL